jgi:hypothetical protein
MRMTIISFMRGYQPIKLVFYLPQRERAIKIQEAIKALYTTIGYEFMLEKMLGNTSKKRLKLI